MSSKVRLIVLIVVPVMLILTLVFGTLLNISLIRTAQASSAIHHIPNLSSCNRGLGCDNKNPTQYQSSKGSCTAGSTNVASDSSRGTLILYYNYNCDVWYLQESTNLEGAFVFVVFIGTVRLHFNSVGLGPPPSPPIYSLTIYDGDYQEPVFGTMGIYGTGSDGSAVALAS